MSLNEEERTAVVTYRLEKAERALMQANIAQVTAMAKRSLENQL